MKEDDDEEEVSINSHSSSSKTRRNKTSQSPAKKMKMEMETNEEKPSATSVFPKIMLISLRAGGVGLNLTSANTVFMVDPWWNEAVENQAINRAFRIGQKRKVTVYRLVIEDSIEEKILKLQEKKEQLIKSTLDFQNSATIKLTVDEIAELLR